MQTAAAEENLSIPRAIVTGRIARLRLLSGLLQGVLLYALYYTARHALWPATNGYLFAPLLLICLFVPVLFISALGHLEKRLLWKWMLAAMAICIVLGVHDIWRLDFAGNWQGERDNLTRFMPSGWMVALSALGFFIAHVFVLAGARDQRRIASYATYFETAWKLAIQIMFAILFVGVLWLILWLGAALFMLVKLDFLRRLLDQSWFVIPVLTFALSTALHVTDVRPRIVHGIRSLLLVLMSWLLPVAALIVGGFLVSLPFAGLEPLWATRQATSVLLGAAAVLVVLINAAFQSGEVAGEVARVLRVAARAACLMLLPIAGIAVYALALRVQQYGWTADRIRAAACLLVAACYAAGYLWAALERGSWLMRIAQTNIVTALLLLAILLSLFTPLADPARLSVASQMARLESGKTLPAQFDFHYLRFEGARYGDTALHSLQARSEGEHAETISTQAKAALSSKNRWERPSQPAATAQTRAANIHVHPARAALPEGFLAQDWSAYDRPYKIPDCLRQADKRCDAYLLDMNDDGHADILIGEVEPNRQLILFSTDVQGQWRSVGAMDIGYGCKQVPQALKDGQYRAVVPSFRDLEAGGRRLHLQPWGDEQADCKP